MVAAAAAADERKVTLTHSFCQAKQALPCSRGASVHGLEHWNNAEHVQRGSYCFPLHAVDDILCRLGRMPRTVHIYVLK